MAIRLRLASGIILAAAMAAVTGCQTTPWVAVSDLSPQAQRVARALSALPDLPPAAPALKRPFFATIHIAGHRTTASGILAYHSPRDFRITAVTELGVILFDARINWAGVTVMRQMPGLDKSIVASLVADISKAFQTPASLDGLSVKGNQLMLRRTGVDGKKYSWAFDAPTGRLKRLDVDLGFFDTLRIDFTQYTSQGWPEDLTITRKARLYQIDLTFTDGSIARAGR